MSTDLLALAGLSQPVLASSPLEEEFAVPLRRLGVGRKSLVGRIAQLVEQRTEKPSSYHSKALQSVPFVRLIGFFYEGRLRFSCFSHIFSSVRPSTCKSK